MIRVGIVERSPVYRYGLVTLFTTAGMHVISATTTDDGPTPDVDVLVLGVLPSAARSDRTPVVLLTWADADSSTPSMPGVTASISRDADIETLVSTVRKVASMPGGP